ncbi:tumor necrosis factor receptor superfamily member 5 [Denticeps clupeoides]|uniref:TNFR-Cys domain-containing protein n=1 Tax=Denticeps clupeoides TaxID=299321 RepID=A0AAY4A3X5_9TELE|nr:tumor necrosis factor receptor superfamily member 5-like [Denticeps clupeoides]
MGCEDCPKGTYVWNPCDGERQAECVPCANDSYTEWRNTLRTCLPCKHCPDINHLEVEQRCRADKDTQCRCMKGFYCSDRECERCSRVKSCVPGTGAVEKPTARSDTVCTACEPGFFNNQTDAETPCRAHTRCEAGRLVKAGTPVSDAVCEPHVCNTHWLLPASLLTLAVVIVFVFVVFIVWMVKCRSKSSGRSPKLDREHPVLTPDIILQHPSELHNQDYAACVPLTPTVYTAANDCTCEYENDGSSLPTMPASLEQPIFKTRYCGDDPAPSCCQSEPQEDEWPGS